MYKMLFEWNSNKQKFKYNKNYKKKNQTIQMASNKVLYLTPSRFLLVIYIKNP